MQAILSTSTSELPYTALDATFVVNAQSSSSFKLIYLAYIISGSVLLGFCFGLIVFLLVAKKQRKRANVAGWVCAVWLLS
jgi:hypothetical protein